MRTPPEDWKLKNIGDADALLQKVLARVWEAEHSDSRMGTNNEREILEQIHSEIDTILRQEAAIVQWAVMMRVASPTGDHEGAYELVAGRSVDAGGDKRKAEALHDARFMLNNSVKFPLLAKQYTKLIAELRNSKQLSLYFSNAELSLDSLIYMLSKNDPADFILEKAGLVDDRKNPTARWEDLRQYYSSLSDVRRRVAKLTGRQPNGNAAQAGMDDPFCLIETIIALAEIPAYASQELTEEIINRSRTAFLPVEVELRAFDHYPLHLFCSTSAWMYPRGRNHPAAISYCSVIGPRDSYYGEPERAKEVQRAYSHLMSGVADATQDTLARFEKLKQEREQDAAAAKIYEDIKDDIQALIQDTARLRRTSLKIESRLTVSNEYFLKHGLFLKRIFLSKQMVSHYGFTTDTNGACTNITDLVESQDDLTKLREVGIGEPQNRTKYETGSFQSAHADCDLATWSPIADYLTRYGQAHKVPLLVDFGSTREGRHPDRLHSLFKMLLQRPDASPRCLFDAQIAVAASAAWRELPELKIVSLQFGDRSVVVEKTMVVSDGRRADAAEVPHSQSSKSIDLEGFTSSCPKELLKCEDNYALQLPDTIRASEFLGVLMRLIRVELLKGAGEQTRNVEASRMEIHSEERHADIFIVCTGRFDDLSKLRLTQESSHHGFSGCLQTMCAAASQDQPAVARTNKLQDFQKLADLSPSSQFIIGQPDAKADGDLGAALFLRLKGRREPLQPEHFKPTESEEQPDTGGRN